MTDQSMSPLPASLCVVAWLFILGGASAFLQFAIAALGGQPRLAVLDAVDLFIGIGLLKLRPGWRTCALVALSIALLLVGIALAGVLLSGATAPVYWTGQFVGRASAAQLALPLLATLALTAWQFRVLIRDDVRALFLPSEYQETTSERDAGLRSGI